MKINIRIIYKKYKNTPLPARAAMWFVICSMLQKCISFITVPIFTRIMSTEQYGIYSTFLSWYTIITVFCSLEMHNCAYINFVVKSNNDKEKDELAVSLLSLSGLITIVLFIIYIIFNSYFNTILGLSTPLVCLIFAQALFDPATNFWTIKQRYEFKYIKLVIRTISMVVCNALLGIVFVLLADKNQAIARATSIVIVSAVFGGIFYVYFFSRNKWKVSCCRWKETLKLQLPLLPHSVSLRMLSSTDKIMINSILGATTAAIYSVAYSVGSIMSILKNSIVDAVRPWIYQKIKKEEYENLYENTKPIFIFILLITLLFIAFAPEFVAIFAPKKYYDSIYVIPPIAASSYFMFIYNMFATVEMYFEETKKLMIASISAAILNLMLNFICIPAFGFVASGYTTLLCYICLSIFHYYAMKGICKKKLKNIKIFNIKCIIFISIILLIFAIIFSFCYKNIVIRYLIIMCIIFFFIIKRKIFIELVKGFKKN